MRVRVVLDLKDKCITVKYHSLLQGLIYNVLFDNVHIKEVHDNGYKIGKRKFKLFTYSELYGKTEYLKETKELLFKDTASFDFTSSNEDLVLSFVSFLSQNQSLILGSKVVKVISYIIIDDSVDNNPITEFTTLSPITAYITNEKKKTIYFDPSSEEFRQSIINNLAQKYFVIYKENMPEVDIINITNIKHKKVYFRNTFSIGYHCSITFDKLTPEVKKVILTCGLGSKNSSGFGMVTK